MAQEIRPSGKKKGGRLVLGDILRYFESFKLKEPVAWLVGGIVNQGETENDIDILLNIPEKESDSTLGRVLRFRLYRSFPEKLRERVHFLYNDGAGPFTSFVPLFSLEARLLSFHRIEMSVTSVVPLRFFKQLKPSQGRFKKEIFSIEALQEIIPEDAYPVEVNQKYDGMRVQMHKKEQIRIWSEDGGDVTSRFPSFVRAMKRITPDVVLDAEITGLNMGRSEVSGYAHTKSAPDDSPFTANVHDVIYYGSDIHKMIRRRRDGLLERLRRFRLTPLKIIDWKYAHNKEELKKYVEFYSERKGSEGAVIKSLSSEYELDGLSTRWWKFKKDFVIDAKVLKKDEVSEDVFSYFCVIEKNIPIGKTFNTSLNVVEGDIIQVAFGNLNKYLDGDKVWYNWVFPRVLGKGKKVASRKEADMLNKESGGFIANKEFPKRFRELLSEELMSESYSPEELSSSALQNDHEQLHSWAYEILSGKEKRYSLQEIKSLHDSISEEIKKRGISHNTPLELDSEAIRRINDIRKHMNKPVDLALFTAFDEFLSSKRKKRFVYQHHWRGQSVHGDLRFEDISEKHLNGWTLLVEEEDKVKEPVKTMEAAQALGKKDIFKIDYSKGESVQKIQSLKKGTQPLVWLSLSGVMAPGRVGATKAFPGVFHIMDKGMYEPGADKPFFKEYFMQGKIYNGRYIFRKLPASGNLHDAGKLPFVWFFWKPKEQTPYILTTRAWKKRDFPLGDTSTSWLPSAMEKEVPEELHWWGSDLTYEEAIEQLKAARKLFLEKKLITLADEQLRFELQRHWWKGQKVIRNLPVEHWDIRFNPGYEFTLDKNPLFDPSGINAIYRKGHDIEKPFGEEEQNIPPGKKGNPNKKIPAHVETLDKGPMDIIEHTEHFMSVDLKGKQLKGFWTFRRTDTSSSQWVFSKGKLPRGMSLALSEMDIETVIDLSDPALHMTRGGIEDMTGISKSTIYKWQKNSDL